MLLLRFGILLFPDLMFREKELQIRMRWMVFILGLLLEMMFLVAILIVDAMSAGRSVPMELVRNPFEK